MAEPSKQPPEEAPPGILLGATLSLVSLLFLPLLGGGYSGAGYQVGFVLLPLAAAILWPSAASRPRASAFVLALFGLSWFVSLLWIQPGRVLWYYLMNIPAAWAVVWAMLQRTPKRAGFILPAVTAGALLTALYGWLAPGGWAEGHVVSTFGLHNSYAGYLLLAWPAALAGAVLAQRWQWRAAYVAVSLVLALTLVLTFSRAAWLVLGLQALALLAFALWRAARRQVRGEMAFAAGTGLTVLLLAGLLALPQIRGHLLSVANFNDYSMQGRLRFWEAAWRMFREHLPMGVGPGNFAYVFPQYQLDWKYYSVDPHSWVMQLLSELGAPGAFIALAILAGVVLWTVRLWRSTGGSPLAAVLVTGVLGSLLHAAVDFDYTFGATTALLGVLLALGCYYTVHPPGAAQPAAPEPIQGKVPGWERFAVWTAAACLLLAALFGEAYTAERFTLDRLRDAPGLSNETRLALLRQAERYGPGNFKTRYQIASVLAQPGALQDKARAEAELAVSLRQNPRYAVGWALKGLLAGPQGEGDLERAIELDRYNYPEHYYFYAMAARDPAQRRARLLLGLARIPIDDPIPPTHIRPQWFNLNPLMIAWYEDLAKLTEDEQEKEMYLRRASAFRVYWQMQTQGKGEGATPAAPPAETQEM